ncbi:PREDICTED: uncharacterized protein LOC104609986 [Nelumbo nucifera]|uniref:Uncharacterized protein LOC104609986 n=2 Tax=Nelumbo nucifera TaxID=4432 RepID=A0A1U8B226_NELNU|nr:PREDICTED: uncharacterized protein LOC104609986 [Nelumbo nucifera]XP_019055394.1 PREDICTED: uncharacterized protein LOC104609986 [Nelumbo nucifera]DAD32125.1 TPA_asm: hypothetical protein HUJ06_010976 [Nelumbo nucifera]
MALIASRVSGGPVVTNMTNATESHGTVYSFAKLSQHTRLHSASQRVEFRRPSNGHLFAAKLSFSSESLWYPCEKPCAYVVFREHSVLCSSAGAHNTEATERVTHPADCSRISRTKVGDEDVEELFDSLLPEHPVIPEGTSYSSRGLAEACKFVCNDAKYVNERARNDIVLLSRGIMRLNDRARQDVAVLGSEFLKLDARAREDTEKIDNSVKRRAERLHHIAMVLKDKAQSKLKSAAEQHWSDGALEADLRRADVIVKRRAMEDALMALEFVKNIHDMMVTKLKQGSLSSDDDMTDCIVLEKNGKSLDIFPEVSTDRITAIQDAYWSMASALSEADGIDYTNPEELELLVATLIDLDAMDGKSSASLLAECSSSPDVNTRKALANALAAAPSMWTLGNAGMGALQRLAQDSNPAVAAAASKAIEELKRQWEIEEGDSWRFTMKQIAMEIDMEEEADEDA